MPFKKPYRICNTPSITPPFATIEKGEEITATFKELKDRYELRIKMPDSLRDHCNVSINCGVLYVHEHDDTDHQKHCRVLGHFILPANVQQNKIQAFYRNYGLKIIMPVLVSDGTMQHIPIMWS